MNQTSPFDYPSPLLTLAAEIGVSPQESTSSYDSRSKPVKRKMAVFRSADGSPARRRPGEPPSLRTRPIDRVRVVGFPESDFHDREALACDKSVDQLGDVLGRRIVVEQVHRLAL